MTDTVYGSSANIEYRNPALCGDESSGGSWSAAWTMTIARSRNPAFENLDAAQGYAQAGYIQTAQATGYEYSGVSEWGQHSRACKQDLSCGGAAGSSFRNVWGTPAGENPPGAGISQVYDTVYNFADGHVHMFAAGRDLGATTYSLIDPDQGWRSDWRVGNYGEVPHRNSDVPGAVGTEVDIDRIGFWNSAGERKFVNTYNACTEPAATRYQCLVTTLGAGAGNHAFRVWTDPL